MSRIVIAVGSTRKPKLAAVREALDEIAGLLAPGAEIAVIGVEVESGVTHTPRTREELMRGARQRAEALEAVARENGKSEHGSLKTAATDANQNGAPRAGDWDYFVGLEGGLDSVEDNGARRVFLESWAFVSDGTRGYFGRSGAVELPPALAEEVFVRGTDLSVAIDQFAQQTGIRDLQGAWGVLTNNQITRQEAFRVAVIAAFAPFYNEAMYRSQASSQRGAPG